MKRSTYNSMQEGHGVLYNNSRSKNPRKPSKYGYCMIDGIVYNIGAWYNKSNQSYSLRIDKFDEQYLQDD